MDPVPSVFNSTLHQFETQIGAQYVHMGMNTAQHGFAMTTQTMYQTTMYPANVTSPVSTSPEQTSNNCNVSDDGHLTNMSQAERRKVLRKATQKRYYEKKKSRSINTSQALQSGKQERGALEWQNNFLRQHNSVLEKLADYKEQVIASVQQAMEATSEALIDATNWRQGGIDPELIIARMFLSLPTDLHIKVFCSSLTYEQFLDHRERCCNQAADLIQEGLINPSGREHVYEKLEVMASVRFRVLKTMAMEKPEILNRLLATFLVPPGSLHDPVPGVNPKLLALPAKLNVTPKQIMQLSKALQEYTKEVQRAKEERSSANATIGRTSCMKEGLGSGFIQTTSSTDAANEYLTILEAMGKYNQGSSIEMAAMAKFLWTGHQVMSALQVAIIIVHCYPHIPDIVQLCDLLINKHDVLAAQQSRSDLESSTSPSSDGVDACHLVAPESY